MLSCECNDDADWFYYPPEDVKPLNRKRWRKCCSCKDIIRPGDDSAEFQCFRNPRNDIEERIHGDEVPMADKFMCDRCFGLFESLSSLNFCISLGDNLVEMCKEYAQMQRDAGIFRGTMKV
jgi:hypothetical protein